MGVDKGEPHQPGAQWPRDSSGPRSSGTWKTRDLSQGAWEGFLELWSVMVMLPLPWPFTGAAHLLADPEGSGGDRPPDPAWVHLQH